MQNISVYISVLVLGYCLGAVHAGLVLPWLVALVVGVVVGITLTLGGLTILWYRVTYIESGKTHTKQTHAVGRDECREGVRERGEWHKAISQGMSLPHAMTTHGCFQGHVYTVVESQWKMEDCILDWPPSLPNFKSWNAEIDQGTLILNPASPSQGEPLGIPLGRCTVAIVRDGLKGRSDFIRRAPLLIRHEKHAIMDGECAFYLFANSPASKMCWVGALRYWSADDAQGYQTVQALYTRYTRREMSGGNHHQDETRVKSPQRLSWRQRSMRSLRALTRDRQAEVQNIGSFIDREWMGSPEKASSHTRKNIKNKTAVGRVSNESESDPDMMNKEDVSADTLPRSGWQKDLPGIRGPDAFLNDLLLRCCFDFSRNPLFSESIAEKIQMQLHRIHKPEYVQSLNVVRVDAGQTCPRISNILSIASPLSDSCMPQVAFDMKYEGSFSITIELRVDIRDSKGWGTLDKALGMIEGRSPSTCLNEGSEEIDLLESVSGMHEAEGIVDRDETPEARTNLGNLRQGAAQRLRKFADSTASKLASIPLRVTLTFTSLEGPMCAWVLPPPGDRLFWSFLTPPKLSISAKPEFGERVFKYAYHASRASAWIAARMKLSFRKNLVFPSGGEFRIPGLVDVDTPLARKDAEEENRTTTNASSSSSPFYEVRVHK